MARPARRLIRLQQEGHLRVVVWNLHALWRTHTPTNIMNSLSPMTTPTKVFALILCADVWRACKRAYYGCSRAWYGNKAGKISINYWNIVAPFFHPLRLYYFHGYFCRTEIKLFGIDLNALILNCIDKQASTGVPPHNRHIGINFTLN